MSAALVRAQNMLHLPTNSETEISATQWATAEEIAAVEYTALCNKVGVLADSTTGAGMQAMAYLICIEMSFITLDFIPGVVIKGRSNYDQTSDGTRYADLTAWRNDYSLKAENLIKSIPQATKPGVRFYNVGQ